MHQLKRNSRGRGILGLTIGEKLNDYKDITKLTEKQIADELGLSHQYISFYLRTRLLDDLIKIEIREDVIPVSSSGILSGLTEDEQKKVHEFISIFMRRNTDEKIINRKRLLIMRDAARKGKTEYEDIKSDLAEK